jgi:hypothetical protein
MRKINKKEKKREKNTKLVKIENTKILENTTHSRKRT